MRWGVFLYSFVFYKNHVCCVETMEKFKTKKSLGQHFLTSGVVPKWLAEAGEVTSSDTVVEVGPGTGALTVELLACGAKVIALETDKRAIEVLQERFANEIENGQLKIIDSDVRELDLSSLKLKDHSFKVVANIPYYLTGQLFRLFLSGAIQPSTLVFLIQKEVAKRATTKLERGEKESLLSLSIKAFGTPLYIRAVGKGHFNPPPKVDSGIIAVRNIRRENFRNLDPNHFFELLHLGFGSKRKQLLGNLSIKYERDQLTEIFTELDIPVKERAENVSLEKWLELAERLK